MRARENDDGRHVRRGVWSIALDVALVCAVVLAISGFSRSDNHLELVVDGQARSVATFDDTVASVLRDEHVQVSTRDVVTPSVGTTASDGLTITVIHARPLSLTVEGQQLQVWTTADTVGSALRELSLDARSAWASEPRRQQIPLSGLSLRVELPDRIVINHDGIASPVVTTAASVAGALRDAGVWLSDRDRVDVGLESQPATGEVVTVVRVDVAQVVRSVDVGPRTVRQPDSSMFEGQTTVVRPGRAGRQTVVYRVIRHDGVVVRREVLSRRVLAEPMVRIVTYGTKQQFLSTSTSDDGLNWGALAQCESGGNPRAVNPAGYYGLYQFAVSTWYAVGGSGNPVDASPSEQTHRAMLLYQRAGSSPWPTCGHLLYS